MGKRQGRDVLIDVRYVENRAPKSGELDSCVVHRKWRRVKECMKERASCDACKVPAREGGSQGPRE